jgi:anti-sigma factor RsiW
MNTCRELTENLYEFIAGELPSERYQILRGHLDGCPTCTALVESYQFTIKLARQLPPASLPCECTNRLRSALTARLRLGG